MAKTPQPEERHWVALGPASRMLEVSVATLRRWADRGLVRSYRTPGGHRRFSLADLRNLTEQTRSALNGGSSNGLAEVALRHIRRRLHSPSTLNQPWYAHIQDDNRGRLRLFGHRLVSLAVEYLVRRKGRPELLAEARVVGEEYGTETAHLGLPLEESIQAFVFFRSSLIDGLQEARASDSSSGAAYRTWQQVNTITDEVLYGIVRSHQKATMMPVAR